MDSIIKELGLSNKNVFSTASDNLFTVVVHKSWLKKWMKNVQVDNTVNNVDFTLQPGESVPYPYRKIFIRVLSKKQAKVLPLPRYKLNERASESPLTFSQLLQYVSRNNQRNLWKESYKKYCQNNDNPKENAIINLLEHDQLLSEVILRLYGCNIIRIKSDGSGNFCEYKEIVPNKYVSKSYETHVNLLAALFTLETDNNYFVIYRGHYNNNLLDCLNFSPNLIDMSYGRGLFIVYQLLNASKAMSDRGLSLGMLTLQDIYLSENLWLQVLPGVVNNVLSLDASLIYEHRSKQATPVAAQTAQKRGEEWCRNEAVQLEKLCMLWTRGRISNLDYLLHLNRLAGRSAMDPQAHFMVPWVTDFTSRCGRNWRDLTKSKYRLNKGDRQLDMTYDVGNCVGQIPHHVTDPLSDITCYVYLARRTSKDVLCKHVRNKWVPAEYPASVQRMQEWTPDECIPEYYTDPTVFKSIHEDLPDLGIPSWATCIEDFITKHREALESSHVSENLHHWIDLTFGYKLSGSAAVKAKNVSLSLVDGHTCMRRGAGVRVLSAPHPPRRPRAPRPAPPLLHWTAPRDTKKTFKADSSDDLTEEDEESSCLPQHVSRLHVPPQRLRRHKSSSRARSLSKSQAEDSLTTSHERASSHSRHYRVQKSELGKGIIYLPKEFNPVATIQTLESLDNFRTKCFFSKADDKEKHKENMTTLNLYPMPQEIKTEVASSSPKEGDDTAFTNHMFLAAYDQNYFRKFSQDAHLENVLKERKSRTFNNRYTTDAVVYKQFVSESRRQDMLVIGCLIVEIFLHSYMRPLRTHSDNFLERYTTCQTVLKHNFSALPKCVSYIASLLLNVQPPSSFFKTELSAKTKEDILKKIIVTDKGLPPPTPCQLLQPLLMQHMIPFPKSFNILYKLLSTLHEYDLTNNELNILYMYECDGVQCEKYENIDEKKMFFQQKIAEGKIQACVTHLDVLLSQIKNLNQFDFMDIFLTHYIELLKSQETSVLAAWYLFDTVSKALGCEQTRQKLLKHILNLYEDDGFVNDKPNQSEVGSLTSSGSNKQKFVKLYHNIFLLQLMVRLGLQCFLDNFTQHLVEAVGGYKDVCSEVGTPGHQCHHQSMANKKPRYSDENLKSALSNTNDIFSPDTSYSSEHMPTPNVEKISETTTESMKERDADSRSENELFHFESDKERLPSRSSRSKSPAESIDSYTLSANVPEQVMNTPSPSAEVFSPTSKDCSPSSNCPTFPKEISGLDNKDQNSETEATKGTMSPTIEIPKKNSMFTSYLHFADDDEKIEVEVRSEPKRRQVNSLDLNHVEKSDLNRSQRFHDDADSERDSNSCKISDMSSQSLIWLAHRLGPVLTCRYITRNLLKMLTLCYIGKENLSPLDSEDRDEFDDISITNSRVVGDRNAMKVINCLTSIVAMYGEQLIIFQYLPHMGELIASCRKRLSSPLEGGVVACLHLLKYLVPFMSDAKLMEQLQDTFLKTILQPALRLASTTRSAYPSGSMARGAVARKLLDAFHVLALRVGPEMTRKHLCVPALQRFFLAFDKATGKTDNWPQQEETVEKWSEWSGVESEGGEGGAGEGFVEICRDGREAEWAVRGGSVRRVGLADLAASPPSSHGAADRQINRAQDELLVVFSEQLAYQAYMTFAKFIGADTMERSLKNPDTIHSMCQKYAHQHSVTSPLRSSRQPILFQSSLSDEPISKKIDITPTNPDIVMDHISSSNSFGSNVTLVGNRIDVASDSRVGTGISGNGFDVVAYKMDNGVRSNRHLRGDWLIYWEHEIGRADKDTRFNLKHIKLQSFAGHTHAVKSLHCLDNENSFMSGSKDKTVKLWSLRNQGDGSATTQCNWTYTGHRKGVLSLSFLESIRLAVSTDSVVHIWDPFMESVVSQLDNIKVPVSIVRSLPGPSAVFVAATTEAALKLIDARVANLTHDLKLQPASSLIRCMCVCTTGAWLACGLASGYVCVLDARAGQPLAHWKAHDGEVLRLAAVDRHRLLSSGLDQVTALWKADDGELISHLKGNTEPVHCLAVRGDEAIWGTTNNRIGVRSLGGGITGSGSVGGTGGAARSSGGGTRLRSDCLRGVLTALCLLPANRLLLLASDSGNITLLC